VDSLPTAIASREARTDADFRSRWPSARTLALEAGFASHTTVRKHIVAMETAGILRRDERVRPNGSRTSNALVLLPSVGTLTSAGTPTPGSVGGSTPGSVRQKPSERSPQEKPSSREDRARVKADEVPTTFPEQLRPHARIVFPLLVDIAEQHNANRVTARGVALAIMGFPNRRYVETAYELASWAQAPSRPIRDVVQSYRTFLKRAPEHAGVERLSEASPSGLPANVSPMRRRGNGRSTAADYQSLKGTMG
jgi:hypothetical protein